MATKNIEITSMSFPPNTAVAKGDTVTWTNKMDMPHTVTADDGNFDSGQMSKGKSFSHAFNTAGTVSYHCENHPAQMKGKVTTT